ILGPDISVIRLENVHKHRILLSPNAGFVRAGDLKVRVRINATPKVELETTRLSAASIIQEDLLVASRALSSDVLRFDLRECTPFRVDRGEADDDAGRFSPEIEVAGLRWWRIKLADQAKELKEEREKNAKWEDNARLVRQENT
ncbi:hypothetical protein PMAYCL1PPCAC_14586, partial [Pristionchus mayeri]